MTVSLAIEHFAIAGEFRIARGAKTVADVIVVEIRRENVVGRGEAVPYPRYGETIESVHAQFAEHAALLGRLSDREQLRHEMKPGALRNAVDLALWDVEGRLRGTPTPRAEIVRSAFTLSLADPEAMARRAAGFAPGTLLKLKLAGDGRDEARLRAVHAARPESELWLDANEGLDVERYRALLPLLESLPVVLLEQPFPADRDGALADLPRPVPVCADESAHDVASIERLAPLYDAVNVKLDKAGGLTEALDVVVRVKRLGMEVVVGCMVSTSLALAPAFVLAKDADFVDLDGFGFLTGDRPGGVAHAGAGELRAPLRALWAG